MQGKRTQQRHASLAIELSSALGRCGFKACEQVDQTADRSGQPGTARPLDRVCVIACMRTFAFARSIDCFFVLHSTQIETSFGYRMFVLLLGT